MIKKVGLILGLIFSFAFSPLKGEKPSTVYLTWVQDPTTTMVIRWHSLKKQRISEVYYQEKDQDQWQCEKGSYQRLSQSDLLVHSVEITGLQPDTEYVFKIGKSHTLYRFKTCPTKLDRPLRFAVGGDGYFYLRLFRKMNKEIAKTDPDFVIFGGDLAYTNGSKGVFKGRNWEIERWGAFLKEWTKQMVTSDGRLIPILPVVGNHDVKSFKNPKQRKSLFYDLFAFPEDNVAYRALDFSNYLSLILLDTGHSYPIEGEQTVWLKNTLSLRQETLYKMAIYHIAAFPSVYSFEGATPTKIRKEWVPFFEQYGVQLAFENHNHAYKRTYPLKGEKIDPEGVIYLGDGAWGVSPRKPVSPSKYWYMAQTAQKNCFWLINLHREKCYAQSVDIEGKIIEKLAVRSKRT
jgi:acid phosphatase type 7